MCGWGWVGGAGLWVGGSGAVAGLWWLGGAGARTHSWWCLWAACTHWWCLWAAYTLSAHPAPLPAHLACVQSHETPVRTMCFTHNGNFLVR